MLRASIFYVGSVVLLAFFGCEVCPFIHSLGRNTLGAILAGFFTAAFLIRIPLLRALSSRVAPLDRPRSRFGVELGLFLAVGLGVTLYDVVVYGFPVVSGLRLAVGCLTFGLFAAIDGALLAERELFEELTRSPAATVPDRYTRSFGTRFMVVAVAALFVLAADLFLLAAQDLVASARAEPGVARELAIETAAALLVIFVLTVNAVVAFSRNLSAVLAGQSRILAAVAEGKLDVRVPVASADEFGMIASHTNQMISGLRDRARVREVLGKLISPSIASRLLANDGVRLGGERRYLVILFSDVRNFTSRTEQADPTAVVADLNRYFTRMVEIVHSHRGVVDKFIGDGLMAVFGLDGEQTAADDAVRAAAAMQQALVKLNTEVSEPLVVGTGIHGGDVVAGTIGAPERLEYTFIGDTVNSAARIEGLTKELSTSVLVSDSVFRVLSPAVAGWNWKDLGEHALRGKQQSLRLHGLRHEDACRGVQR